MAVLEVVDAVDVAGMTADRLVELDSDHGLIVRAVLREVADVQNRAVAIAVDPNPVADPVYVRRRLGQTSAPQQCQASCGWR